MIAVAIDGPAGAGKSTIARKAAEALGFIYVDTGALYRTVGLYISRSNIDSADKALVENALPKISIELKFENGLQQMYLNGENVSDAIRTPEASMTASTVSAIPAVRAFLLEQQRGLARTHNVVMDGRDIGTVVLPDAEIKIFLTALPEERARRRYDELMAKGAQVNYDDVLSDIIKRDHQDETRPIAPLKPAEDSVILDTTGNTRDKSIEVMIALIRSKL